MSDIKRYYWIGTNADGKHITTMTLIDVPPQELRMPHDIDLGLPDDVYTNFIPTTKEEILERRKKINSL
jgi:hypothetical protein